MTEKLLELLKEEHLRHERERLCAAACCSGDAVRRQPDANADRDHRPAFAIDADRILYSRAYARYIDKTQVFSLVPNDHITHRALHVQFLSKIARTIGGALGLNVELVEAIALGHDIGHPPFGHDGERMLASIAAPVLNEPFSHNSQSVRILESIERQGQGLNLTLQTLDGILCHNGEEEYVQCAPAAAEGFGEFDALVQRVAAGGQARQPATLEGCLVKVCDTISYVGRDFEDAVILRLVGRDELPSAVRDVLGDTAGKIVYTLVTDAIRQSYGCTAIALSAHVAAALSQLKRFNYEAIYNDSRIKTQHGKIRAMMETMFHAFLGDLERGDESSPVVTDFISEAGDDYRRRNTNVRIVVDYLASMTDRYFLDIYRERFIAVPLPRYFS